MEGSSLIDRLLDVIERDIVPLTEAGVAKGNKIFGAAILRKSDLSLVIAETNNETANPLFHGEIHCITQLYARAGKKTETPPKECIFLSTHEPCTMCMSAIAWGGYDNWYCLFSHEDSRDAFNIPHDLRILKEVFGLEPGGYNKSNRYWTGHDLVKLANDAQKRRIDGLRATYARLSDAYQQSKSLGNDIPLN